MGVKYVVDSCRLYERIVYLMPGRSKSGNVEFIEAGSLVAFCKMSVSYVLVQIRARQHSRFVPVEEDPYLWQDSGED